MATLTFKNYSEEELRLVSTAAAAIAGADEGEEIDLDSLRKVIQLCQDALAMELTARD